jgi:hypothetical protein
MTTLAEYNNNPGNIRPAKGVKYEGMIGVDDKGFAIFETPKFGQQALINDITHKLEKRGIKTPSDFVDVYTPKSDENSEDARDNYKIYLAQKTGLKSTNDPFPENSVEKLAQAITNFEGGKWQEGNEAEQPKSTTTAAPATVPASIKVPAASTAPGAVENAIMGVVGGATGAKIASGIEGGKQALPLIQTLVNKATGSDAYMHRPQSRVGLQRYLNSQIAPDLRIPLSELEKVAGEGKPIRTMSEVQDALANIKGEPMERVSKTASINPATSQPRKIYTTTPGKPPIDLSAYKFNPTVVTRAADQAAHAADIVKGALPSVARIGVGGLGGALAGSQLYDAFKQYRQEGEGLHMPSARNAAQFASGAGGALGMLPFGVTQGLGMALQAPELAYQGYEGLKALNERRKHATREDVNRMLTNVDPMGNPIP